MTMARANGKTLRRSAEQLAKSWPALLVEADRVAATVVQGVHGRRRVGMGEAFWQFRAYQAGDSASLIDWRQSAKRQKTFVRENEWEAAQSVWIWRDGSASMRWRSATDLPGKIERANVLSVALASLLVRGGERVALLGDGRPPQAGRSMLERLALALADPGYPGPSLPPALNLPRFASLVLIGDFLSPLAEIDACLTGFAQRGALGHVLAIADPAEEDLPYRGRVRFFGLEKETPLLLERVEDLKPDWRRRLDLRHVAIRAIAHKLGFTFSRHRTDKPAETALLALYGALAGEASAIKAGLGSQRV
jgi:uncharacterized protein (DUF58 family)